MVWYYAEGNQQRGPLSDAEFDEMVAQGRISRETLVWQDGMEDWQALQVVRPNATLPARPAASAPYMPQSAAGGPLESNSTPAAGVAYVAPAAAPASITTTPATGSVVSPAASPWVPCHHCGRTVPVSEITRYGAVNICSVCRPGFVSQVYQVEGAAPPAAAYGVAGGAQAVTYGGFWIRAIARSLDHILIAIIQAIALTPFMGPLMALAEQVRGVDDYIRLAPEMQAATLKFWPYMVLISVAYHAGLVALFSATPGKLLCRLRVVSADGSRVNLAQAVSRAVLPGLLILSQHTAIGPIGMIVLMVAYLMVAWDLQKRSLFDRIVGTRVIKKP